MKKVLFFIGIAFFISFTFRTSSFAATVDGGGQYCATPPFVTTANITPNVLIILDNSNSMDEDFYGAAVGSYSPDSKTVVAKIDLRNFINSLKSKLKIGLMTYKLPTSGIKDDRLDNSQYFASYNPKSYCAPNSSDFDAAISAAVDYCKTGNTASELTESNLCSKNNPSFDPNYFDEIFNKYSIGSSVRNKYCELVYPKTQKIVNLSDKSHYIYFKHQYPDYGETTSNPIFCYAYKYNSVDGSIKDRKFYCYSSKTGTSDSNSGYTGKINKKPLEYQPTDSDYALGYKEFGKRLPATYVGHTWFTNSSPGDGYLHNEIASLVDSSGNTTSAYTSLYKILVPDTNDESAYMNCKKSNKNKCSHIINAGLTPTAGTLQSAIDYFKGAYGNKNTPIQYSCQKNFIVYVTDGLPSVNENGNSGSADSLMPTVLKKLNNLRNLSVTIGGKTNTYDIQTYVLGMGLSANTKSKLDAMAAAGGTAAENNGHAFYADKPNDLTSALNKIFFNILKNASSGSAASVVSTNGKSGANIVQALFFPKKTFSSGAEVSWTGDLKNFWYYLGPFAQNIREDNDTSTADTSGPVLDLAKDYIMEFDSSDPTMVNLFADTNGNGTKDNSEGTISINNTVPIWDAGYQLFQQLPSSRYIFTAIGGGNTFTSAPFTSADSSNLMTYLDTSSATSAAALINYIRGADSSGFRSRTVTIGTSSGVYKLGDIIYSTPKIISSLPAGDYYKDYNDQTYKDFIDSDAYKNRMGIVVVGANDGMLHAFKLGKPTVLSGQGSRIFLLDRTESDGTLGKPLGSELWAYIPENILPYLKYYADPNYCHLYYVDLTPTVVDASIYDSSSASYDNSVVADKTKTESSWRTIVIGGLRFGGACGASNSSSAAIHPPALNSPATGVGRSSYFAIDVTNTEHPKLLWEFTDNNLAFSTTGPAVIHIPAKNANGSYDNTKNGSWYVAFGSGPDKYDGTVNQPLYLYALDLGTGILEHKWQLSGATCASSSTLTCNISVIGNHNAFAGRLTNGVIDLGEDYSDDALYFGYNYHQGSSWDGGILRLVTNDDETPSNWKISKLIGGIGPVTASTSVLQDKTNNKLWVFAGTGRYFTASDDSTAQRDLYGIIDPCYNGSGYKDNGSCSNVLALAKSSLTNVTSDSSSANATNGWYINLDPSTSSANAERLISDPVVSSNGTVLFATTAPTSDICSYGGNSYVWELNYSNGGALSSSELSSFLIQTSTGAITKINAADFSNSSSKSGRRSKKISGVAPPTSSITVIGSPLPINRFIHWYER